MTKTNKEKVIKKVRKEIVKRTAPSKELIMTATPAKDCNENAITLIIVWLAILIVLVIYLSIK